MCGIAGYLSAVPDPKLDLRTISRKLIVNIQARGRDASGYAYRHEDGNLMVGKGPLMAWELVKGAPLWKEWPNPKELILHTRARTQGTQYRNENNHPLYCDESGLCMIHNGWLLNEDEVVTAFKIQKQAEVDSETLLNLISRTYRKGRGPKKSIVAGMKYLVGAFSCAMMANDKPGEVWLWRRDNPLVLAANKERNIMFFASTAEDIKRSLAGEDEKFTSWELPNNRIMSIRTVRGQIRCMMFELPPEITADHKLYGTSGYYAGPWGEHEGYPTDWSESKQGTSVTYVSNHRSCAVCGDEYEPIDENFVTCPACNKSGMAVSKDMWNEVSYEAEKNGAATAHNVPAIVAKYGTNGNGNGNGKHMPTPALNDELDRKQEKRRCILCGMLFEVWKDSGFLSCFDCDYILREPLTVARVQRALIKMYGKEKIRECANRSLKHPGASHPWRATDNPAYE